MLTGTQALYGAKYCGARSAPIKSSSPSYCLYQTARDSLLGIWGVRISSISAETKQSNGRERAQMACDEDKLEQLVDEYIA